MKGAHLSTWRMIFKLFASQLYCAILWASGNYCGQLDLVITLADRAIDFKT